MQTQNRPGRYVGCTLHAKVVLHQKDTAGSLTYDAVDLFHAERRPGATLFPDAILPFFQIQ